MKYKIDTCMYKYLINTDTHKLFHLELVEKIVKKKQVIVEKLWCWKAIKDVGDALDYISIVERVPIWKLRSQMKKIEGAI